MLTVVLRESVEVMRVVHNCLHPWRLWESRLWPGLVYHAAGCIESYHIGRVQSIVVPCAAWDMKSDTVARDI